MSGLERLTREVENDLQKWCDAPLLPLLCVPQDDGRVPDDCYQTIAAETFYGDAPTPIHQATTSESAECGVRYQRCGGGRRVIRKGRSD